jgi:hypothetical protein
VNSTRTDARCERLRSPAGIALLPLLGCLALTACGLATSAGGAGTTLTSTAIALTSSSGPLTLTVQRQPAAHGVIITLTVANHTSGSLTYVGGCQQPYTVRLVTTGGTLVHQWPHPSRCYAITIVALAPGESATFPVEGADRLTGAGGAPLASGTYDVDATFALASYTDAGPTSFTARVQLTWTA